MEEEKKASYFVSQISEYRLLNALIYNPEYLYDARITDDILPSETAKSIMQSIRYLRDHNLQITKASLFQAGASIDYNVTEAIIDRIFEFDQGTDDLDGILAVLRNEKQKAFLLNNIDALRTQVAKPGELNYSQISNALYSMEGFTTIQDQESPLISPDQWFDDYIEDLEARKDGRTYSYGDDLLDRAVTKGAYPGAITICAASTSMGKSTYVLKLVNGQINMNIPCMYISLEMGEIDTMDRLIAMRCGLKVEDLYSQEPGMLDSVIARVQEERKELVGNRNFYFSEDPSVDINKLRAMIREFKQKTRSDYCFVVIDLLTQLKNFMSSKNGSSTATAMEIGMNDLNALAKEENVHILGVVQFNRDSDKGKPSNWDDIQRLKPSLSSVKNSSALAERARVLFSVFRPKYYSDRYLQDDEEAKNKDDIMEITILKNSSGAPGKVLRYAFDNKRFYLSPIDEDAERQKDIDMMIGDY